MRAARLGSDFSTLEMLGFESGSPDPLPNTAERSPTPERRNPAPERDLGEAAEGIRTLDLLHGKQTL
jgi:hypothetical protein